MESGCKSFSLWGKVYKVKGLSSSLMGSFTPKKGITGKERENNI
jgi:hypothetical protein